MINNIEMVSVVRIYYNVTHDNPIGHVIVTVPDGIQLVSIVSPNTCTDVVLISHMHHHNLLFTNICGKKSSCYALEKQNSA